MRTDKEIDHEVWKLEQQRPQMRGKAIVLLDAQIDTLKYRLDLKKVEVRYYMDETDVEYEDGDNDVYHEACFALRWMNGEKGYKAPSE